MRQLQITPQSSTRRVIATSKISFPPHSANNLANQFAAMFPAFSSLSISSSATNAYRASPSSAECTRSPPSTRTNITAIDIFTFSSLITRSKSSRGFAKLKPPSRTPRPPKRHPSPRLSRLPSSPPYLTPARVRRLLPNPYNSLWSPYLVVDATYRPISAYALFFRDTQAAIKTNSPTASFGEVSKLVASLWDSLPDLEKSVSFDSVKNSFSMSRCFRGVANATSRFAAEKSI